MGLPLMAFGFSTSGGTLFEIEPNTKEVVAEVDIPGSTAGGEYAFSKINKHLFVRNYNDCSCGVDKDTGVACELSRDQSYKGLKNVTVTTGPNMDLNRQQDGFSGKFCRGSKADTEGVWEYEPSTRQFLAKHKVPGAYGAKPFNTPDGDLILLASGDGSNTVSVLKPRQKGQASSMVGTIKLSFGNTEGKHDASDIDFVKHGNKLFAIFSSTLHNHVMVADLTPFYSATASQPITIDNTVDILLHEGLESSAKWDPRGINVRRIRVIPDSKYFWVDAPEIKIVYEILDLDSKDIVYVPPSVESQALASSTNTSKDLAILSTVLSSLAIVVAMGLLIKGKAYAPARIRNSKAKNMEVAKEAKKADLENPSLPSLR